MGFQGRWAINLPERQSFEVFENLEAALRRWRRSKKDRLLWMDAIRITQVGLEERRQQVLQMRTIYEQAQQVFIWFGEVAEGGRAGMKRLSYWSSWGVHTLYWWANRRQGHPIRRDCSSSKALQANNDALKEQEFGEISQILDRPWWRRVWIVQEIVLARNAIFLCGPDEVH